MVNEKIEDMEILRFFDLDVPVDMIKVSLGVDTFDNLDELSRDKLLLSP